MFEMISLEEIELTEAELEAVYGAVYGDDDAANPNHASFCRGLITGSIPVYNGTSVVQEPATFTITECCKPTCDCQPMGMVW